MGTAQATATVGRRVFPSGGTVTLTAGGQSLTLTGREAAMVVDIALNAADLATVEHAVLWYYLSPDEIQPHLWVTTRRKRFPPTRISSPPLAVGSG